MSGLLNLVRGYPLYRAGLQTGLFIGFFMGVAFVSITIVTALIVVGGLK